jgi:hypothetical protein
VREADFATVLASTLFGELVFEVVEFFFEVVEFFFEVVACDVPALSEP